MIATRFRRCCLPFAALLGLVSCSTLNERQLADLVAAGIEGAQFRSMADLPIPVKITPIELHNPHGLGPEEVEARFSELLQDVLESPRHGPTTTFMGRAPVFAAISEITGDPDLDAAQSWSALRDDRIRSRVLEKRSVDFFLRATLGYDETHWTLEMEFLDARDGRVLVTRGRQTR